MFITSFAIWYILSTSTTRLIRLSVIRTIKNIFSILSKCSGLRRFFSFPNRGRYWQLGHVWRFIYTMLLHCRPGSISFNRRKKATPGPYWIERILFTIISAARNKDRYTTRLNPRCCIPGHRGDGRCVFPITVRNYGRYNKGPMLSGNIRSLTGYAMRARFRSTWSNPLKRQCPRSPAEAGLHSRLRPTAWKYFTLKFTDYHRGVAYAGIN